MAESHCALAHSPHPRQAMASKSEKRLSFWNKRLKMCRTLERLVRVVPQTRGTPHWVLLTLHCVC